jgi:hypothetical protein
MDLYQALVEVERRTLLLEATITANSQWLTADFLSDESFTPQTYVVRAQWQRHLHRELSTLVESLTNVEPLDVIA